jgi:hypothetical protein
MSKTEENYIDHEVRVRVLEGTTKDIKDTLVRLEDKIDSHFKWNLSTMLMLIVAVLSFMIAVYFK